MEVEGTTGAGSEVELTINEVDHGCGGDTTDLYAVSGIVVNSDYSTSGGAPGSSEAGRRTVTTLQPTRFRYRLLPA